MCMQNFIKIYQKVHEIGSVSLFQNLNLGKTSTNYKCRNPMSYILSISKCMQNFITIFYSVQEIGPFSLFQNLALGKASTDDKCYLAIPWARSCQYQSVCTFLSKHSKRFKSYGHFFVNCPGTARQSLDR